MLDGGRVFLKTILSSNRLMKMREKESLVGRKGKAGRKERLMGWKGCLEGKAGEKERLM